MVIRMDQYLKRKAQRNPGFITLRHIFRRYRSPYKAIANPMIKLEVSPKSINRYRSRGFETPEQYWEKGGYWNVSDEVKFDKWEDLGAIYNGDWDRNTLDLTKLPKYVGMRQRIKQGVPWAETDLFEYYRSLIGDGVRVDGCETEKELLNRYQRIELMCQEIRDNGYRARNELCDAGDFDCLMDEVTVSIGRDGEFIFGDGGGWHRLSAAKILGVESIPVRVLVRHEGWQHIRDKIHTSTSVEEISGDMRCYLTHPDIVQCDIIDHPTISG